MSSNKGKSPAYKITYLHHLAESSSRNYSSAEETYRTKEVVHAEQVKQLDKRLRILEDEAEIIKVALLEDMEERRKLVNAIHYEFQAVNHFLRLGDRTFQYQSINDMDSHKFLVKNQIQQLSSEN